MKISYEMLPQESYKAVYVGYEGGVKKYKMKSAHPDVKGMEYPNNPIIQSIAKRFSTQRGREPIYSMSYGVDWDKFVGKSMTRELVLDIEHEIVTSLKMSKYIDSVDVVIGALDIDKIGVNVTVKIKKEYTTTLNRQRQFLLSRQVSI